MSERLFRMNTTEFKWIRIACQKAGCGSSTEIPLERLELGGHPHCAVCREPFFDQHSMTLQTFAKMVRAMNDLKEKVKFEFTVPVSE